MPFYTLARFLSNAQWFFYNGCTICRMHKNTIELGLGLGIPRLHKSIESVEHIYSYK